MGKPLSFFCITCVAAIMVQSGCSDKDTLSQGQSAQMSTAAPSSSGPAVLSETAPAKTLVTQTHSSGLSATWVPFGAHLQSVTLPDGTNVLAGYDAAEDYTGGGPYLGSMIGRVGNRLGGATFTIDGQVYAVARNEGDNSLHSGPDSFDQQGWDITREDDELVFRHTSPAGHQGFPGTLDVTVRTSVSARELRVKFIAITDAPTPVNLSQHGYWNPAGLFDAPIDKLLLRSPADRFTAVGETLIPTGETATVEGTPYDFRQARPIGPGFLDVNLLVPGTGLREMAVLSDGVRTITVLSDYPGLQVYSGEALAGITGLVPRGALAMEPQYPPDAVNQPVDGMDTILHPGEVYRHTIIYRFDGPEFDVPTLQDVTP